MKSSFQKNHVEDPFVRSHFGSSYGLTRKCRPCVVLFASRAQQQAVVRAIFNECGDDKLAEYEPVLALEEK